MHLDPCPAPGSGPLGAKMHHSFFSPIKVIEYLVLLFIRIILFFLAKRK